MKTNSTPILRARATAAAIMLLLPPAQSLAQPLDLADQLPLVRGFYLSDQADTCDEASNATISLLHRDGFNSSRHAHCVFTQISWISDAAFDYVASCSEPNADGEAMDVTGRIEILSDRGFSQTGPLGTTSWYYCAQENLPEPWRWNDISDLID